jgi:hypothetical protein
MSKINDDAELDLELDLDLDLVEEPRKRLRVQETRPDPNAITDERVAKLAEGLIYGRYGNGVAYDAKNARKGPTDPAAAKLSDQIFGKALRKTDRDKIEKAAKRSGADYVGDAHIGTFDDDAWRDAADVIQDRKMQELKDAANDAATAIDENENQEDYDALNNAIAAIDENEKKQQTKKQRRGGKGRKTNTKPKSKKQRKQRKNTSRKSSRRNQKK